MAAAVRTRSTGDRATFFGITKTRHSLPTAFGITKTRHSLPTALVTAFS